MNRYTVGCVIETPQSLTDDQCVRASDLLQDIVADAIGVTKDGLELEGIISAPDPLSVDDGYIYFGEVEVDQT